MWCLLVRRTRGLLRSRERRKGSSACLEKRGTRVKKNHHQFFARRVLDQIPHSRVKKTRKIRHGRDTPFWTHCRRFLAPLWSNPRPSGHGRRRWSRSRPSEDATGRALLRPSRCPSHRQVATKTRDDARPLRGGLRGRTYAARDSADDG